MELLALHRTPRIAAPVRLVLTLIRGESERINEILNNLIDCDVNKSRAEKIRSLSSNVFKGALRVGASLALGDYEGYLNSYT